MVKGDVTKSGGLPVDVRVDPVLATVVHVVGTRQARPNLPATSCPFCPGGLEAPKPYDVRSIPNRWPAMPDDRCHVVLYTDEHAATFWSIGVDGVRRVIDLWAERTTALGARSEVDYVLVFENRGPDVGATISHPHGQIYAYDHVPSRPAKVFGGGWQPDQDAPERLVATAGAWQASVPFASTWPIALTIAPTTHRPDLPALGDTERNDLATLLVDVFERLDRLYDVPLPYMMWINQRPTGDGVWDDAWLHIDIVSPWRRAGVARFIAAAEVACEEFFNPVVPEVLAHDLRRLGSSRSVG